MCYNIFTTRGIYSYLSCFSWFQPAVSGRIHFRLHQVFSWFLSPTRSQRDEMQKRQNTHVFQQRHYMQEMHVLCLVSLTPSRTLSGQLKLVVSQDSFLFLFDCVLCGFVFRYYHQIQSMQMPKLVSISCLSTVSRRENFVVCGVIFACFRLAVFMPKLLQSFQNLHFFWRCHYLHYVHLPWLVWNTCWQINSGLWKTIVRQKVLGYFLSAVFCRTFHQKVEESMFAQNVTTCKTCNSRSCFS